MKIYTDQNVTQAVEKQDSFTDRHLPIYLRRYSIRLSPPDISNMSVLWSTVGFIPSYTDLERILNIRMAVSILEPLVINNSVEEINFIVDFSFFAEFVRNEYFITFDGLLQGNISFTSLPKSFDATQYLSYFYDPSTLQLMITFDIIPELPDSYPTTMYMNISIRDDIDDTVPYPDLSPVQIANDILQMPRGQDPDDPDQPNTGTGVGIVLVLLTDSTRSLKTLQASTVNINDPNAFNPTTEIVLALERQGITATPSRINFSIVPARNDYPVIGDAVPFMPWKESSSMVMIANEMQILYSSVPDCDVLILYDYQTDPIQPSFMEWLSNNTHAYDMVIVTQRPVLPFFWPPPFFLTTKEFYDERIEIITNAGKAFICSGVNNGKDLSLQTFDPNYNFLATNVRTITVTTFRLIFDKTTRTYPLGGPYIASINSFGGYCDGVPQPPQQFDYVPGNNYGVPAIAGYNGPTIVVSGYDQDLKPTLSTVIGSQYATPPLAAIFAKIYDTTEKRNWDFKYILGKKGVNLCQYITRGQNRGTNNQNRYFCKDFKFWNPVVGFGNLNFGYLYDMCSFIQNNTYVQISNVGLNNLVSFLNVFPRNTFDDFLPRQPSFGFSSIFSFFKLYVAPPSGSVSKETFPVETTSLVYFLDITEQYALSYASANDSMGNPKLYILINEFNAGDESQQWRIFDANNPNVMRPIFAFDHLSILPSQYIDFYMSSVWNANGSPRPASPSFRNTGVDSTETFTLNTDPSFNEVVQDILTDQANDIANYSYYVNFTYTLTPSNEMLYLSNPNLLSYQSAIDNPEAIYTMRDDVQRLQEFCRWGHFDPYPQWILVPLTLPYTPKLYANQPYMIFNTIASAYLYKDQLQPSVMMKPISASITNTIPLTKFTFNLAQVSTKNEEIVPLFQKTNPVKPGLPPFASDEFGIPQTNVSIFNTYRPAFSVNRVDYYTWNSPMAFNDRLVTRQSLTPPDATEEHVRMFWVFKKYIVESSRPFQIFAFNNLPQTIQDGNGQVLSSTPNLQVPGSPSLTLNYTDLNTYWRCLCDTHVDDVYTTSSQYIWLDENIKQHSSTNVRFLSDASTALSNNNAIGVTTTGSQQPRMINFDSTNPPSTVLWSATTVNQFVISNKLFRSNYFYLGLTYSFFSYTDTQQSGFLSSVKLTNLQPSMFKPNVTDDQFVGNKNTIFTII